MRRLITSVIVVAACVFPFDVDCRAAEKTKVDWRLPLHVTYASGFSDVTDYYERLLRVDVNAIPIGVAFSPYAEFDYSSWTGSAVGMQIGPVEFVFWDSEVTGGSGSISDSGLFLAVPLVLYYGQMFAPEKSVSPYVKIGYSYPFVSGDAVEEVSPGFFAALGVDFMRQKRVGVGLEFAIDKSTVTFKEQYDPFGNYMPEEEIAPIDFAASFKIVF